MANGQDQATWTAEAAVIAATRRSIVWRSPSRHDGPDGEEPELSDDGVFVGEGALSEMIPAAAQRDDERIEIQGGRERGLVMHKLLEEVLTGETEEGADTLEMRARNLLSELGVAEADARRRRSPCAGARGVSETCAWNSGGGRAKAPLTAGNDRILRGACGARAWSTLAASRMR